MTFTITITRDEDGVYIAECPAIPGCVSQGKTEAEAQANVQDAIKQCLEARAEIGHAFDRPHSSSRSHRVMPPVPILPPSEVIKIFQRLGWQIVRQKGSHIIMTRPGHMATLSIPNHPEVARGTLRSLIAKAGLTVEQFLAASNK